MKPTLTFFDRLMTAITFAEANEPELAREFADDRKPVQTSPTHYPAKMTGGKALTNQATH